jgi:6-phosphogluconate dehydrogenase
MSKADIGLIGLGVMGRNLAMNMADHGYRVSACERDQTLRTEFAASEAKDKSIILYDTLEQLTATLEPPRAIMLMITAGEPVDQQIALLKPLLQRDDLIIDGGNSHYIHTRERYHALAADGIQYVGMGVSGGESGARSGPSIMAGGTAAGFARVQKIFQDIAARVDDEPCCAYLGEDAAGHFVKMIHNGIEYADMQLIAEVYHIMKTMLHLPHLEMQDLYNEWNQGELTSYLIEITAAILGTPDPETGQPLVEMIMDRAGQKGTGLWASQAALELGVPAPTIIEAVSARALSMLKEERIVADRLIHPKTLSPKDARLAEILPGALLSAKICAYAQGFAVMRAASQLYQWNLPLADISRIWRGGCIIRAKFLNNIMQAFQRNTDLYNLLFDPYFQVQLQKHQLSLRRVVATAVAAGIPIPALSSALAYFDSYRNSRLPANLIQAQRDYFGAHGYQRIDKPGVFHSDWTKKE